MNTIPRRIYYLKINGQFIYDTGEMTSSGLKPTTFEEDFKIYPELSKYNKEEVGVLQLEVGQYAEEFKQCSSFSIDVITKDIVFLYPEEKPFEPSLFDKVSLLQEENQMLGMEQSGREIQQIILGQQLAELEIRLLMGGL